MSDKITVKQLREMLAQFAETDVVMVTMATSGVRRGEFSTLKAVEQGDWDRQNTDGDPEYDLRPPVRMDYESDEEYQQAMEDHQSRLFKIVLLKG